MQVLRCVLRPLRAFVLLLFALGGIGPVPISAQWVAQPQFHTSNPLTAVRVLPNGRGLITGWGNVLLCTSNGGNTWSGTGSADPDLTAASLVGDTFYIANREGGIFRLNNPGICLPEVLALGQMSMTPLQDLNQRDAQRGYALVGGALRYSSNNWTSSVLVSGPGCPSQGAALALSRDDRVFVAESGGRIVEVQRLGSVFSCQQKASAGTALHAIHFADSLHGYAAGDGGMVLASANGGQDWEIRSVPGGQDLRAVHAPAANRVYAAGDALYTSSNGGLSWFEQEKPEGMTRALALWFISEEQGWVAGLNGAIGFTGNGGGPGLALGQTVPPEEERAATAFPNPFGDALQLSGPKGMNWTLYNVWGWPVAEGRLEASQQSLDTRHLPTGSYVLQLGEIRMPLFKTATESRP
jgi:photosystem II stability/assembly factor-like uncharacterized protein